LEYLPRSSATILDMYGKLIDYHIYLVL
jgi:hypothetical protein